MIGFLRGLLTLAWPWWIWMGLLVTVNGIVPLAFLGSREARWILFGEWTGQGPPRLYVRAALLSGGMLLSRQLSVTVSESATWLQTEGWLDSENGLLIFEVE